MRRQRHPASRQWAETETFRCPPAMHSPHGNSRLGKGFLRSTRTCSASWTSRCGAHGLTLSQSGVLIFLDDAPDQRVRMAELAKGVLLSSSGGTRLVERLERLGYVTRRAAPDDRRGLFAELTDAGRHVVKAARATYREGVRATFLDRLRAADQVGLSVISTRVSGGHV